MEVLLEVKDLRTYYHTYSHTVPAADDVNFVVHRGEVVGLVGESGCGKSTVARSVVGLIDKTYTSIESGQILFDGKDLTKATKKELCDIRGNKISMIFQDPFVSLSPVYTVGDQIFEVMKAHDPKLKKKDAKPAILVLMQKMGIPSPGMRINDYPYQMSGGMQQRIMIAIALACNPDILIADEPTTALDITVQTQVLDLMRELKDEYQMSVILISHNLGVVASMCDRIMVMYGGVVVEGGSSVDIIMIWIFSLQLRWLPSSGTGDWKNLIMPMLAMSFSPLSNIARLTRSSLQDAFNREYIDGARMKGVKESVVVVRHALRNSLIPVVTGVGMQLGTILGGTVVVETVFTWPGMGMLLVTAAKQRDFPTVQYGILLVAASVTLVNILIDISYGYLDPRIREDFK